MTEAAATARVYVVLAAEARPVLVRWSTWWDRPFNYDSYALVARGDQGGQGGQGGQDERVLVDPVGMDEEAQRRLVALLGGTPAAIVLTNDYHERDAYALREQWGAPVWAPAYGTVARGGELEGEPDRLYEDGETLPGGLRAVKIDGAFAGDTVLVWSAPTGQRVLFTGDTLNGHFNPENPNGVHPRRGQRGLYVGAGPIYLQRFRPEALKRSLRPLLAEPLDLICGAHGEPWADDARGTLQRLVELDWRPCLAERRHPVVG